MDQNTHDAVQLESETVTCARCGAVAEGMPLNWTCSVENRRRCYFCVDCARDNIRAIESRLDSSWW
ncbi:hypothetical protein ACQUSR_10750 [Streptomyces sp. P1-3]|uniref:hypothetical protein n=1 Tax=unclassified Streptomyces TaxID=2593676 RepID=UPI0026F46295|nr:hypothetical protein [Streptomyces sp. XD-27]WKX72471.1 hypothetical protein Q3Y56_23490 [Streptomyces sp. XD-27]